jgi:hypothetical protein
MTNLAGDFQTDLPMNGAFDACTEAIHGLGWRIGNVEPDRIVSYADSGSTKHPLKIEVILSENGSGQTTDVRIIGTDSDIHPINEQALIAELDRVRDAIQACVEKARTASRGQDDDEGQLRQVPQLAAQRRQLLDRVRQSDGELTIPASELLAEFGLSEFTPSALETLRALLITVQIQTSPELDQISPTDSVTLSVAGTSSNGRAAVGPDVAATPEPSTERREAAPELDEAAPEPKEAAPELEEAAPEPKEASTQPETNRLALVAFVLSLVWLLGAGSLLGILLGGIAQRQIDQSPEPQRGRGLATGAIVLGAIGAVAAIAVIIAIASPSGGNGAS